MSIETSQHLGILDINSPDEDVDRHIVTVKEEYQYQEVIVSKWLKSHNNYATVLYFVTVNIRRLVIK